MKNLASTLLSGVLLLAPVTGSMHAEERAIPVTMEENAVSFEVHPLMKQGSVWGPFERGQAWISSHARKNIKHPSGNTSGNLNNNGHYAFYKETIYYNNPADEGKLYKQKSDGSERRKISDDGYVEYINVVDDNIFYFSDHQLIRTKLDGTERVVLRDFGVGGLNVMSVVGEWIYYTEGHEMFGALYRMRTDGTSIKKLESNPVSRLVVDKERVYYVIHTHKLFVLDANVEGKKKLLDGGSIASLILKGTSLFFNYNGQLYTMGTDGQSLTELSDRDARNLNIDGEWLYYSDHSEYSKKLYRIHLRDRTVQKLNDQKTFNIHLAANRIFYYSPDRNEIVSINIP
ncbi:DUF5050 domain-containing protein [Paenibacillus methanolicus]|uniref:Uncharacterized protein DUF5050 n=1 Tax=Paenibacillus methanolicus TaxID=582686 RepID=A0A5S5C4X0_9BACL|nr:DUF5050 domain-containing protein [Paenibacillus methanolicus]TYP74481.1 uncharacterized protein DUF5050 [Paenibacillus methanolicus]